MTKTEIPTIRTMQDSDDLAFALDRFGHETFDLSILQWDGSVIAGRVDVETADGAIFNLRIRKVRRHHRLGPSARRYDVEVMW